MNFNRATTILAVLALAIGLHAQQRTTQMPVNGDIATAVFGAGAVTNSSGQIISVAPGPMWCNGSQFNIANTTFSVANGVTQYVVLNCASYTVDLRNQPANSRTEVNLAKAVGASGSVSITDLRIAGNFSNSANQAVSAFCTGTVGSAETEYLNDAACSGATTATAATVAISAGAIHDLQVSLGTAVKASASGVAATVYDNGSATTLTCTVATNTATCSDTTHVVTVAAGDRLQVKFGATNASDTAANVAASFIKN